MCSPTVDVRLTAVIARFSFTHSNVGFFVGLLASAQPFDVSRDLIPP